MNGPTEEQHCTMVDNCMSPPEPLHTAALSDFDWVYYRPWGVMAVAPGFHVVARAMLLAFHHGFPDYIDLARHRGIDGPRAIYDMADAFLLELPGTAFLSSLSDLVTVGRPEHLDSRERTCIRNHNFPIRYLEGCP